MNGVKTETGDSAGWVVYIIRASDNSLYTGITTNLRRRFAQHRAGKGAKYFFGRAPCLITYAERCVDRAHASRREAELKSLAKAEKESLVAAFDHADCGDLFTDIPSEWIDVS